MCTLLKVANRRPVNLISPFFVHEEQITSVGSTGDNSAGLARFSCTVRVFSALSAFFTRFPRFGTLAVRAAPRPRPQRGADADRASCGLFAHLAATKGGSILEGARKYANG